MLRQSLLILYLRLLLRSLPERGLFSVEVCRLGEGGRTVFPGLRNRLSLPETILEPRGPAGLGRESLYKALSPEGDSEFATVLTVVQALGLQLWAVHLCSIPRRVLDCGSLLHPHPHRQRNPHTRKHRLPSSELGDLLQVGFGDP
ncbi:MAG: hypothetical protein ACLFS5_13615, partial [Spirochaetaceae bacterium]